MSDVVLRRRLWARGILVFCLVGLLWAWIALPWLSGEVTIPYDAKAHFQAQIQFLANALHRGDSPFWTPNIFGGSPQIADPQSLIFSPAFLLALFDKAPSFRTMDAYVLVLLLCGGLACARFGQERGWHPAAQVVAALVFAFGASSSWRLQHIGQVQSLACFAVAFWLLARALTHRSWRSGLSAGLAAGMMAVKPDQVAFIGVYLLAAYAAWFLLKDAQPAAATRRALPALAAAGAAGLAIVAVPLLMTILFSEVSNRAEIDFVEAGRGSLHPASLLTAFVGDLFGAKDPFVEYWGPSSFAWSPGNLTLSQNMGQVYVGSLPIVAIVLWLARGWRHVDPEARFLLGALLATVVYAVGSYTPAFAVIFALLPGADNFRRPADATFLVGALLALLSGYAMHEAMTWRARGGEARRTALIAAGVVALALVAAAMIAFWRDKLGAAAPAIASSAAWLCAALCALLMLRRLALSTRAPARAASLAAFCGMMAMFGLDLKANNGPNESTALPPSIYAVMDPETDNHTVSYLKALLARSQREPGRRDRIEFLGMDFHWPNIGMIHGFDHAFGYNPLHMADFTEATGARDHMGGAKDRKFTAMFPSFRSIFSDMLGLRYVISSVPVETVDRSLKPGDLSLLARTRDAFIYENPRALPRAMFVRGVRIADFAALLEDGLPADFDPRKTVLLERLGEDAVLNASAAAAPEAKVRLVSYANTEVVVEVDSASAGYLVLNDVWHPWWTVTVNDDDADILKANVLFRAVQVEAGKSLVRFRFRPLDGAIAELREKVLGAEDDETAAMLSMVP